MKTILTGLSLLLLVSCSAKDINDAGFKPLTEAEVTEALKDALSIGVVRSAATASQTDGFYSSPQLKIEFPDGTEKMQNTLRKIGLSAQVDQALMQINRAAETASAKAKPVFIKAITAMEIDHAFDILNGASDAATSYLSDAARDDLYEQFAPLVEQALEDTSAARYYRDITERYNALPLTYNVDPDLTDYVTEAAVDGLFLLIAQEEAIIRSISSARRSRLMKRVFGSLD